VGQLLPSAGACLVNGTPSQSSANQAADPTLIGLENWRSRSSPSGYEVAKDINIYCLPEPKFWASFAVGEKRSLQVALRAVCDVCGVE